MGAIIGANRSNIGASYSALASFTNNLGSSFLYAANTIPGGGMDIFDLPGFCRNELMSWCENNGVAFVFGLARNQRLRKIIGQQMHQATQQWNQTGKPARIFSEFDYRTRKEQ